VTDPIARVDGAVVASGVLERLPPAVGTLSTYWSAPELLGGITEKALAPAGSRRAITKASIVARLFITLTAHKIRSASTEADSW
jgi:hypothetical protein